MYMWTQILFWVLIAVVFYAYLGYGFVLYILVKVKRIISPTKKWHDGQAGFPDVVFIVAAYNEEDYIEEKIKNCLNFDYPANNIEFWFVTDGSNDRTSSLVEHYPTRPGQVIKLFHSPERRGKIAAVERVMPFVKAPITIFTDANTNVNPMAIKNIVRHYNDPKVGAVAGEKRIALGEKGNATDAGEGIYWKYESLLKKWDSELYSTIGAAGELFSILTDQYRHVPSDTLIEDFVMTMGIAMRGYKIAYEPDAYAIETSSASIKEELKRKIRIAAGGLQAAWRLRSLLNPFKFGLLSFQYISHRLLRWTLAPLALPIIFFLNWVMVVNGERFYAVLFLLQCLFYLFALLGYVFEKRHMKIKAFFIPYYFCVMNYAMYRGFFRLMAGRQSVVWEKAKRAS